MNSAYYFTSYFTTMEKSIHSIDNDLLKQAMELILDTQQKGRKLIFVGNGGSAAMASHLCVDFTKSAGIRAINFNEADLITCFANDYGYEHWVEKALEAYADEGDLAILISSSGKSPNILNGARQARQKNMQVITVTGFFPDNPLRLLGDVNLWVDSKAYNVVEMTHHIWLLAIADHISEVNGRHN